MSNKKQAEEYYKYFSTKEGNQHIAGLFAIEKLLDLVEANRPKKILEVGLGIGSISYSIIDYLSNKQVSFEYYGTEANDFCLSELPKNLNGHYSKIKLHSRIEDLSTDEKYDLIIIDGSDSSIEKLAKLTSTHAVLFIEGDRTPQQKIITQLFPKNKLVHSISNYKEPNYGPFNSNNWSGGGKIIYTNPNFKQKLDWFSEKLRSSYRNRVTRKFS